MKLLKLWRLDTTVSPPKSLGEMYDPKIMMIFVISAVILLLLIAAVTIVLSIRKAKEKQMLDEMKARAEIRKKEEQ